MNKKHYSKVIKFFKIIFILLVFIGVWNVWKPLPKEINNNWGQHAVTSSDLLFLTDTTYVSTEGVQVVHQYIFDEVFSMIHNAKTFIVIDMFLWNDFEMVDKEAHRKLSSELTEALIAKKKANKDITILVLSDPINTVYGGQESVHFSNMRASGINVTLTNLPVLRDSNPILSSLWRMFVYPLDVVHMYFFHAPYTFKIFPNILNTNGEKITLRAYAGLLNFKANHRKLIIIDEDKNKITKLVTLITSANPHDGSSAHSNVALKVEGNLAEDALLSEKKIFELAGTSFTIPSFTHQEEKGNIMVHLVTDGAILSEARSMIQATKEGDSIDILMFYFSERHIIQDIRKAAERGVNIRMILDPNKDAFGREKNGIPNRETAASLLKEKPKSLEIRWCDTHGEQCHGKMLIVKKGNVHNLLLGSANFTRRNIGGYNLESNISVAANETYTAWDDASAYFKSLWNNTQGIFSVPYEHYEDTSKLKRIVSWIMENTGLGTF